MILSYNYAQYVGIIDLFIFILFIIAVILGIKKGFLTKTISLANAIFGFIFALLFCVKFANGVLYPWFGESIEGNFYNNIISNETFASIQTTDDAVNIMSQLGIPNFISQLILANMDMTGPELMHAAAHGLASWVTTGFLVVLSFIILFFGTTLICFILKLITKLLRTSKFVRVIDGILGVALYSVLLYILLQIVFCIIIIVFRKMGAGSGLYNFINFDILGKTGDIEGLRDAPFRISRWLCENNLLGNLIGLLF